ncbi:MAG TPA: ISKra4 family transposase [Longimicrobium sp.]|jgi:hypothetical protein|nr:ISKra4 family transposase [Longimicrobium sp.]
MTQCLSASQRADLHAVVREWYRAQPPAQDLAAAEQFATEVGRAAAACAFECGVQACGTRAGYHGTSVRCACGQSARFVGYRRRWVRGVPGEVGVTRAYYHCGACHCGIVPWDAAQGLDQQVFTPTCKALLTEVCAREGSYRQAQTVLARHHALGLEVSSLEAVVGTVGRRMRAAEDARCRAWFEKEQRPEADPLLAQAVGQRFYVSLDAGKAHIDGSWHDVKAAACYVGEPPTPRAQAQGQTWDRAGPTRYLAIQEEAAAFGQRAYLFALRLGYERARATVVLGDGAEWIWKIAEHHFSDAVQILDFYHASEHVWAISRAVFGAESGEGSAWARACSEQLQTEGVPGFLRSLRQLRGRELSAAVQEAVLREVRYFRKNRRRLRYPEFRAAGLMIGSGPVEAACKVVIGARLKGAGMRWSGAGADAMLVARTALLGEQYEEIARYARAV